MAEQRDNPRDNALKSVWGLVDRAAYSQNLTQLVQLGRERDLSRLTRNSNNRDWDLVEVKGLLPFGVEKQLAEDFAFLAACDKSRDHVSAASVAFRSHSDSLCVSLASNQGIDPRVEAGFHELFEILSECAYQRKFGIGSNTEYRS